MNKNTYHSLEIIFGSLELLQISNKSYKICDFILKSGRIDKAHILISFNKSVFVFHLFINILA